MYKFIIHQKHFILTASDLKLLVGVGVSNNGYISDVEIIDFQNSTNFCFNLKEFPNHLEKTSALMVEGTPLICGKLFQLFYSRQKFKEKIYSLLLGFKVISRPYFGTLRPFIQLIS